MSMLFEFFPLLLFLGTLLLKDIYAAVIVLMVTMPIGLLVKALRTGSFDRMDNCHSEAFLRNPGGGAIGAVDLRYVPEPSAVVLFGLGFLGTLVMRRRRS